MNSDIQYLKDRIAYIESYLALHNTSYFTTDATEHFPYGYYVYTDKEMEFFKDHGREIVKIWGYYMGEGDATHAKYEAELHGYAKGGNHLLSDQDEYMTKYLAGLKLPTFVELSTSRC